MPNIQKDDTVDALYIELDHQRAISHTVELTPDILVDVAADDTVVGIDIQYFSQLVEQGTRVTGPTPTQRLTIAQNSPIP